MPAAAATAVARWQALYESASAGKQLVLLIDLGGFGMRNFDKFFVEHAFRYLLSHHPQRMGLCLMINAPTVFNTAWGVIKGWIPEGLSSKFHFVDDATLLHYLPPEAATPLDPTDAAARALRYRGHRTGDLRRARGAYNSVVPTTGPNAVPLPGGGRTGAPPSPQAVATAPAPPPPPPPPPVQTPQSPFAQPPPPQTQPPAQLPPSVASVAASVTPSVVIPAASAATPAAAPSSAHATRGGGGGGSLPRVDSAAKLALRAAYGESAFRNGNGNGGGGAAYANGNGGDGGGGAAPFASPPPGNGAAAATPATTTAITAASAAATPGPSGATAVAAMMTPAPVATTPASTVLPSLPPASPYTNGGIVGMTPVAAATGGGSVAFAASSAAPASRPISPSGQPPPPPPPSQPSQPESSPAPSPALRNPSAVKYVDTLLGRANRKQARAHHIMRRPFLPAFPSHPACHVLLPLPSSSAMRHQTNQHREQVPAEEARQALAYFEAAKESNEQRDFSAACS